MNKKQLFLIIAVSISSILYSANHDIPYTDNLSLMRAIWNDDIEQATDYLPLLHTRTTFCPYGYLHEARSKNMAYFLIQKGALESTLHQERLIMSAMHYEIQASVVQFYLERNLASPTFIDSNHFTALHKLAIQADNYIDTTECLKKASLLLEPLDTAAIKTLCKTHDLMCGRDVFDCIKQAKESFGRIDDFELIHNESCCNQLHDYLKTKLYKKENTDE